MKKSKRKPGWYWVKLTCGPWIVGEWNGKWWFFCARTRAYPLTDTTRIGPRISPPKEERRGKE